MNYPSFIDKLEKKLSLPLPGIQAQALMSPVDYNHYIKKRDNHKVACVTCLLYQGDQGWTVILIERQKIHPEDKHGGQLGFPGGKIEETDVSLVHCALRETQEEIGILPDQIKVIGQLSELYVYVSNFLVYPFVCFLEKVPLLIPEPSEVKSILHFPLKFLKEPKIKRRKDITVRDRLIKDVPYYDVSGKTLWGATAMMMSELEQILPNE